MGILASALLKPQSPEKETAGGCYSLDRKSPWLVPFLLTALSTSSSVVRLHVSLPSYNINKLRETCGQYRSAIPTDCRLSRVTQGSVRVMLIAILFQTNVHQILCLLCYRLCEGFAFLRVGDDFSSSAILSRPQQSAYMLQKLKFSLNVVLKQKQAPVLQQLERKLQRGSGLHLFC